MHVCTIERVTKSAPVLPRRSHDNHIVVIDSGKHQLIQLHKLQLDGKIVNISTIASKDVSNFQLQLNITA